MARHITIVQAVVDTSESSDDSQPMRLDERSCAAWLTSSGAKGFRYEHPAGGFTARHERRKAGWYWYAYRKRNGVVHKAYLGRTADLTPERLAKAAIELSDLARAAPRPTA